MLLPLRSVPSLVMIAVVTRLAATPSAAPVRSTAAAFAHAHGGLRGLRLRRGAESVLNRKPACIHKAAAFAGGSHAPRLTAALHVRSNPKQVLTHMKAAASSQEESGLWADGGVTFAGLGLNDKMVDALEKLGFARPTRIQAATLPEILSGKNVVMGAETGSGKTLAYTLPILQRVLGERETWDKHPKVLVLVPNQELARQVAAVVANLVTANEALSVPLTVLAGSAGLGNDVCAVLVATPSAVLRNTNPAYLEQVHTAIVDEADMMLDGGFVADVTRILDFLCPRVSNTEVRRLTRAGKTAEDGKADLPRVPAQVIFAAATLPDWKGDKVKSVVRVLRKRFPDAVHIATEQLHKQSVMASHDWIDLGSMSSSEDAHVALLALLRGERQGHRTMVFCNTVTDAKEAHQFVRDNGFERALVLHKEISPAERAAALARLATLPSSSSHDKALEEGEWILICTDIAARGIDIPDVKHVVQLQFAANAVSHLHRVGRTARAGSTGGHVTNFRDDASRPVALAIKQEGEAWHVRCTMCGVACEVWHVETSGEVCHVQSSSKQESLVCLAAVAMSCLLQLLCLAASINPALCLSNHEAVVCCS